MLLDYDSTLVYEAGSLRKTKMLKRFTSSVWVGTSLWHDSFSLSNESEPSCLCSAGEACDEWSVSLSARGVWPQWILQWAGCVGRDCLHHQGRSQTMEWGRISKPRLDNGRSYSEPLILSVPHTFNVTDLLMSLPLVSHGPLSFSRGGVLPVHWGWCPSQQINYFHYMYHYRGGAEHKTHWAERSHQ